MDLITTTRSSLVVSSRRQKRLLLPLRSLPGRGVPNKGFRGRGAWLGVRVFAQFSGPARKHSYL